MSKKEVSLFPVTVEPDNFRYCASHNLIPDSTKLCIMMHDSIFERDSLFSGPFLITIWYFLLRPLSQWMVHRLAAAVQNIWPTDLIYMKFVFHVYRSERASCEGCLRETANDFSQPINTCLKLLIICETSFARFDWWWDQNSHTMS